MGSTELRVEALYRFPVKSMQGERLSSVEVGNHGFVGDRHWGVVDLDTGLVLTARREPALLMATARIVAPPVDDAELPPEVEIELPDGSVAADDNELSAWLGRPVELRRAEPHTVGTYEIALSLEDEDAGPWVQWSGPHGSYHDSKRTQVSLVAAGSARDWDWRRFRANVVISGHDGADDALVGHRLGIGEATFDVAKHIDRCVMTTRPQPDGIDHDMSVLTTINTQRNSVLGVGMVVAATGSISVGDTVSVLEPATG